MKKNFILFHKTGNFPAHLNVCLKQIQKTQNNYDIFLLTDQTLTNTKNVNIVPLKDLQNQELESVDFYKSDNDPLWRTSFERFFYINQFILQNNIDNIIHFDNDVLLYQDLENIIHDLAKHVTNLGITQHKTDEFVCGFTFIKNKNSLQQICNELLDLAKHGTTKLETILGSMPHEMRLLGHIYKTTDLITSLPGLPFNEDTNEVNSLDYVFDPSTYGQYFGANNTVHSSNTQRLIDKYIVDGTIVPTFDRELMKPFIIYKDKKIPIINLHIHSKKLTDFTNV
jgi:hypothetical protein